MKKKLTFVGFVPLDKHISQTSTSTQIKHTQTEKLNVKSALGK